MNNSFVVQGVSKHYQNHEVQKKFTDVDKNVRDAQ